MNFIEQLLAMTGTSAPKNKHKSRGHSNPKSRIGRNRNRFNARSATLQGKIKS